jgi:hypothetical protein
MWKKLKRKLALYQANNKSQRKPFYVMGRSPRGPVCPRAGPVQRHDGDGGGGVGDVT